MHTYPMCSGQTYGLKAKSLCFKTLSHSLFTTSTHCSPQPVFSFPGGKSTVWPSDFSSINILEIVAFGSSYYNETVVLDLIISNKLPIHEHSKPYLSENGQLKRRRISSCKIVNRQSLTSCGGSKFFPHSLMSQAHKDVKLKNCSPGFVGTAK